MTVAIIPARGGSKRIPGKNIKAFAGLPMIAHSIRAAQASGLFERILVTTDSDAITDVARAYGAETPFRRPQELSDDVATTAAVLEHTLLWLREHGQAPAHACCLYATAPFVEPADLQRGFDILHGAGASCAFTVTTFPFPIFRALQIRENGSLAMFWPEHRLTRSQDLPEAYHDAGQFYWVDVGRFLVQRTLYPDDSRPIVLPRHRVQDIDTLEDWENAEHMFDALSWHKRTGER